MGSSRLISGGTFTLYSLLCRYARLSVLPDQEAADESPSTYMTEDSVDTWHNPVLNLIFKKHPRFCEALLVFVLLGTSMATGDKVITPAISVFSAASGIKLKIIELLDIWRGSLGGAAYSVREPERNVGLENGGAILECKEPFTVEILDYVKYGEAQPWIHTVYSVSPCDVSSPDCSTL